ncbi:hypothetical protein E7T06_07205 [Deinococcus sp. Arct2-2]|uniref:hypothetical protein n=1 Tax=Deinococcus sp. Arct2-2 TaxID=2568653 RepID=UPI0010A4CFCE|nr:hypothetical protein [Deinococcus sp. Arct2-2]THF70486.1 hypothetical protein E7T06_07205 [Deinococcus sp. Arct2-2]
MKRHGLSVQVQVKDGEPQPLGEHLVIELLNGDHLVSTHVGHDVEQLFETVYEHALPLLEKINAAPGG